MASRKVIPVGSLFQLRQRLDRLPPKSPERATQIAAVAQLYGVSSTTVYRALQAFPKPRAAHRADRGTPRVLPQAELERYCELIAALKLRTTNKQGRHLSTQRAIEILEQYGVETSQGLMRAPQGVLHKTTINIYLRQWHVDHPRLTRQPPAVRFEAEQSNACWQCDMSPSDLKHLETPDWIDPSKGTPTLMLFSVVDDRSGVSDMEYRCVYGEDAESALRFLFNAMAPKVDPAFPFQGRPALIYLDNGPVAKSRVFQTVMLALGIAWQTHVAAGKDDNRVLVSKSLAVEKHRITLGTLITALFYDLSTEKPLRIPTQSEKRERDLRDLVKKGKRPVVLFVDEAHDLTRHTLTDLKRLMEVVEDGDGKLAIVLAGHPKLGNDLRRPTMEEIGYRTDVFTLDGIAGSQREYLQWLLRVCTAGKIEPEMMLTTDAIDLLASKLRTPLQMQRHLTLALEVGDQTGEQPISAGMVDTVLSQQFDDLEPTLTRHGYHITDLVQQFDAKPTEIKALFSNQLDPTRTAALRDRMLRAGLPI